jgi:hypothetical protein
MNAVNAPPFNAPFAGGFEFRVSSFEFPGFHQPLERFVLLGADDFQVFDAVLHGFDMAKHHGDAAGQAQAVRGVHHTHPLRGTGLERGNAVAHAVHEDFPAATRQRSQPGGHEVPQDRFHRLVEELAEGDDLAGAEAVDVDLRELRLDAREQVQIPLLRQLRVMPALHENLRAAQRHGLLDLAVHLLRRDDVAVGVLLGAVEGAELAIDVADVGVVDVAVNDVGDDLVAASAVGRGAVELAAAVGQRAQLIQGQRVEPPRLGGVNAPAIPDLLEQIVE